MIIGIGGWERCLKTGLASILAIAIGQKNLSINMKDLLSLVFLTGMQKYDIKKGFGNLNLNGTTYPWNYQDNKELVETIRLANENHINDTLFLIDEADSVYNPRDYDRKQQTANLKGIGQHAKMGNIYIYTYQLGQPEDTLLGVDKILRSNTRIEFEMRYYDSEEHYAIFKLKNRLIPDMPLINGVIECVDKYYPCWDHKEPVV